MRWWATAWLAVGLLPALLGCAGTPAPAERAAVPVAGTTATQAVPPGSTPGAANSAPVAVPRVKGKTATAARWRLEQAGFKVKVKWTRDSRKRGTVIAQRPSGGKKRPGSTVVVTVSTGAGRAAPTQSGSGSSSGSESAEGAAARAFREQASGISLKGKGVVTRILSDDNDGSRHQRFILRLASGQTLLIAHNIDIAPRVRSLDPGDTVSFSGVYEWSAEGGTVHWTHHDPGGQHPAGWLKHEGSTFQ